MPSKQRWDRHSIKAEIHRRDQTLEGLAEANGLARGSIQTSLDRPFPKADRAISKFLGVPLHQLWPNRYRSNGKRIYSRAKPNPKHSAAASQKSQTCADNQQAA